jgi:hypothetical protein
MTSRGPIFGSASTIASFMIDPGTSVVLQTRTINAMARVMGR